MVSVSISYAKCLRMLNLFTALTMEQSLCRNCDFVRVSEPSGIIASVVTKESKCGSNDCPWLITVPKGQRINVTLLNFAWGKKRNMFGGHGFSPENRCRTVLATLKEPGKSKTALSLLLTFNNIDTFTSSSCTNMCHLGLLIISYALCDILNTEFHFSDLFCF